MRVSSSPPPYPRRRPPGAAFSPRFTLLLLYFFALVVLFGLLFALPALVDAYRELPPGTGELTPEELARARETARTALAGKVPWTIVAAVATLAVGLWRNVLPGLKRG